MTIDRISPAQAIDELAATTTGVLTANLVMEGDLDRLFNAVLAGNERAPLFLDAWLKIIDYVGHSDPKQQTPCCGCCQKPIELPDLIGCAVISAATADTVGDMIVIALCRRCATSRPAALAVVRYMIERDHPDAEILDATHGQEGRA